MEDDFAIVQAAQIHIANSNANILRQSAKWMIKTSTMSASNSIFRYVCLRDFGMLLLRILCQLQFAGNKDVSISWKWCKKKKKSMVFVWKE